MPLGKKLEVTAASIEAGFNLHRSEPLSMNPFEVARQVAVFFEQQQIEYFLGGSIASTTYGEPRFTQDVDIIVRLPQNKVALLVEQMQSHFYLSEVALLDAVKRRSSANLIHLETNFKVDLLISRERPFEESRFHRKVRKETPGGEFWFCTPEDIVLAKLEWYHQSGEVLGGQLRDVQTVLMVQDQLDLEYLHRWATELGLTALLEQTLRDAGR